MMESSITRICGKCTIKRLIKDFSKDNTRGDGLHPYCRLCRNEQQEKRRKIRLKTDIHYANKIRSYDRVRYKGQRKENNLIRLRKRTKDQIKDWFIKSKYGISLRDYERIFKEQNGVCAICFNPETRKNKYTEVCRLHIDHDHQTKKIRGLLCHKCNSGLGYFRDNQKLLENAMKYLQKSLQ